MSYEAGMVLSYAKRIALIERMKARQKLASEIKLSKIIYERGVDDEGFARIRSKGDETLFGGITTLQMKHKLKMPKNRPIADFLPTITITAKNLATEITNFNVQKDDLKGENKVTTEHVKNNTDVRKLLLKSGIQPEKLPPEEDIKKLERKVKAEEKGTAGSSKNHQINFYKPLCFHTLYVITALQHSHQNQREIRST